jgi:superfamily II DNA or RNA helicase
MNDTKMTVLTNAKITVHAPSKEILAFAKTQLSYTDKSKEYQLNKMASSAWGRNSPLFTKLKSEVSGQLYKYDPVSSVLEFSSGFYELFSNQFPGLPVEDRRCETGSVIALPWADKPYDMRPYQEEAVELMLSSRRGVVNFATGLGKTLLSVHLIKRNKKRALVVCPSESVASQFFSILEKSFGSNRVGFYGDGKKKIKDITVGIAASISKNVTEFANNDLGLVIVDETHHTPASTFYAIAEGLGDVGKMFGLTATDYRSDGKDIMITGGCGPVIIRRDIKWGVDNGWLAEPYFIVQSVETTGRDIKGDKLKNYKEHVLNCPVMKARIEDDCRKMMAAGKSVLCLVDEVAHGQELSRALGIPFATGKDKQSQEYVEQLNDGKIPGLIGTDGKIGEGSDTKNVDVLILANFTVSKGPVIQAVGRGLRKQGTKTKCVILDYIPKGSTMLTRHAMMRVKIYREITGKVKLN